MIPCCDCCQLAADPFSRADSTDLGTKWVERTGDLFIEDAQAHSTTADSLAIYDKPGIAHPPATGAGSTMAVLVTVAGQSAGDQAIVAIGYEDDDNYNYALLEFGAADAELSLWKVVGGTHTQVRGPYLICGRGVGVATRLKICQHNGAEPIVNVYALDPATEVEIFKGRAAELKAAGNYGGIGTGDIVGQVTFGNFRLERTAFTHASKNCPGCENCPFCPDTQEVCSFLQGFGGSVDGPVHMVRSSDYAEEEDDGGGGAPRPFNSHAYNCRWLGDGDSPENPTLAEIVSLYIQKATDSHYYLWGLLDTRGTSLSFCGWIYRADLGTCPPNCATWDCVELEFFDYVPCPSEDPGSEPTAPYPIWTVSSGDLCCYYEGGNDNCCDGVTLPGTVYLSGYGATDLALTKTYQDATGYSFDTSSGGASYTVRCYVDGLDDPVTVPPGRTLFTKVGPGIGERVDVLLDVISCDPYYATGTGIVVTE